MAKRLGIGGEPNTGKSFSRRWIPDGDNVVVVQPSEKDAHLYTGPKNAHSMTPAELDEAVKAGTRKPLGYLDVKSPEAKFQNLKEAVAKLPNQSPFTNEFDALDMLTHKKATGYFQKDHITGNIVYAPRFRDMKRAGDFVSKHMPWVHTLIIPDFTHFVTEAVTSEEFRSRKHGGEAFARYDDLGADAYRSFIKSSDEWRRDLIVVTEFHLDYDEKLQRVGLFLPGGQQLKNKFKPESYYDFLLFTDTVYEDMADDDDAPQYKYVTRKTQRYPGARSLDIFPELRIDNNINEVLKAMRKHYGLDYTVKA